MTQTEVKKETSIDWLMNQLYKKGFIKEIDGNEPIKLMKQAKEIDREQHEYRWDNCKKIIHEGFVYVKYNDLLECEKSFKNCT